MNDELPDQSEQSGPGARLRAAREARRHTVKDAAEALRLSEATVRALEDNDMSRLPPETFVRGYLRSYARWLDVPEGEVVASRTDDSAEMTMAPIAIERRDMDLAAVGRGRQLAGLLIGLLLLVLAGVWGINHLRQPATPVVPDPRVMSSPDVPAATHRGSPPAVVAESADVEPVIPDLTSSPEAPFVPEQPLGVNEPSAFVAEDSVVEQPAVSAPPEVTEQATGSEAVRVTVNLEFREESWVEVSDVQGRLLLYKLAADDSQARVEGEPPLQVYLGNAPGVSITVDNQPFDTAPFTRRNKVARFTIPAP